MSRISTCTQKAQALAEFMLVALLLFTIMLVIFDFGRAVFYYNNISNAAREGARYGVVHPNDSSGIVNAVCAHSTGVDLGCPSPSTTVCGLGLDPQVTCPSPPTTTVTIATEPNAVTGDDYIQVQIVYTFSPIMPLVGLFIDGGQIPIDVESSMRIER